MYNVIEYLVMIFISPSSWHDARSAAAGHDGDAHAARHARHDAWHAAARHARYDAWHAAAGHDGDAHAAGHAR